MGAAVGAFRDQLIAASLKPIRVGGAVPREFPFRDQLIAASLKLIASTTVVQTPSAFPRSIDRGLIEARASPCHAAPRHLSAIN